MCFTLTNPLSWKCTPHYTTKDPRSRSRLHARIYFMQFLSAALLLFASRASACGYASSGLPPPLDDIHRHLVDGFTYTVLPRPVSTANNAFVQADLQQPLELLTGNDMSLLENLDDFASKTGDDLCYWAFQALPPPRGGPTFWHPRRGYWDVSDGHNDQDIEWVQAYAEVAVARLHSRIEKGGPVVGAMCTMGAVIVKRRCENGRSRKEKCIPAITNATIQWPMAVSIWKVGHPELEAAVQDWRRLPGPKRVLCSPCLITAANAIVDEHGRRQLREHGTVNRPGVDETEGPGAVCWRVAQVARYICAARRVDHIGVLTRRETPLRLSIAKTADPNH